MIIDNYFSILESLTFPYKYIASFTQHCNNPAVWGHYANNHKGICLKFRTQKLDDNSIGLSLKNNSYSNSYSESSFHFSKIYYKEKYPEYNFFQSLGSLPLYILNQWFLDEKGNQSSSTNLIKNEELWRNEYWKNFGQNNSIKLREWEYENEYRLIMASSFVETKEDKNNRIFEYNFSDLEGIIFGMKTPNEKKLEIIKTIFDKCKKESRTDFKFYQADYNSKKGLIDIKEMASLNSHICSEIQKTKTP